MEIIAIVVIIILVGLFIIPNKTKKPDGCLCKWGAITLDVNYECPIHGDHIEPLYPIEEIKTAGMSEREKANHDAGLYVNQLLKDKED